MLANHLLTFCHVPRTSSLPGRQIKEHSFANLSIMQAARQTYKLGEERRRIGTQSDTSTTWFTLHFPSYALVFLPPTDPVPPISFTLSCGFRQSQSSDHLDDLGALMHVAASHMLRITGPHPAEFEAFWSTKLTFQTGSTSLFRLIIAS
ncbi:unnamed protein product [Protopolystoma xenopodis]|uniref:Uncharacterized protein n=1 Tax=Protopolystoma xenopodis TaxID=117903 RepID=A0A448X031_9PLAT|nr:unnamed protein product [Protopolystoma xenopodis]